MVKVVLRQIPYDIRYLPYGQGGFKEDTLRSKGA